MRLQYIGGGHLPGVPSRNLTAEEVKKYGEKTLLASGLYHPYKAKKQATKKED